MINLNDYAFGSNQFIVIPLSYEDWIKLFSEQFKIDYRALLDKFNAIISKWYFCDYEAPDGKFITFLPFIDTEKINKIMMFCNVNKEYRRNLHVLCSKDVYHILNNLLPKIKIDIVEFESFIRNFAIY